MKQAERFSKAYKQEIDTYLDFREMLAVEARNIEAEIVSLPDWVHCEHVCACLRANKA